MTHDQRHECVDCGAWMQFTSVLGIERLRCPWTCYGDTPPAEGAWACGRPFHRTLKANSVKPFSWAAALS